MVLDKESIAERIKVLEDQLMNDRDRFDFDSPGKYLAQIEEINAMKFCLENDIPTIEQRIRELRQIILEMQIMKMDDILVLMKFTVNRNILKEVIARESN